MGYKIWELPNMCNGHILIFLTYATAEYREKVLFIWLVHYENELIWESIFQRKLWFVLWLEVTVSAEVEWVISSKLVYALEEIEYGVYKNEIVLYWRELFQSVEIEIFYNLI